MISYLFIAFRKKLIIMNLLTIKIVKNNSMKKEESCKYLSTYFNYFKKIIDTESNAQQRPVVDNRNVEKWFKYT